MLSHISWPFGSNISVSIAAFVSILGAVLAVRDGKMRIPTSFLWLFLGENGLEKSIFVPGLQNLGNNCFLNVVLQTLASCSSFQTFINSLIQEYGIEDSRVRKPLTFALASLLEELSFVSSEKVLLDPQRVMRAMSDYIPNFNLTSQQDAAEAFNHLLCSLREEFGDSYAPKATSLADSFAPNRRILTPIQGAWQTERERWQRLFLGPFDGILGSILTCQSCSSQISLSFESFDCLPLSTVHAGGSTIPFGRTLVDCLKQFIVAEHVENYHCNHCWHNAAIKYLSLREGNEMEIDELNRCSKEKFCNCQNLKDLEKLPWSNRSSHTLKQLSIARCPRILCIQLKRVSLNFLGEPDKLQGHISFPLILDLFPFTTSKLGIKIKGADTQTLPTTLHSNRSIPISSQYTHQSDNGMLELNGINGSRNGLTNIVDHLDNVSVTPENGQKLHGDTMFVGNGGSSETINGGSSETINRNTHTQFTDEVGVSRNGINGKSDNSMLELNGINGKCDNSMLELNGINGSRNGLTNIVDHLDNVSVTPENGQKLHGDTMFLGNEGSLETINGNTHTQFTEEVGVSNGSVSQQTCLYQLVSVVEHYGKSGSGHYIVYRRATESLNPFDYRFNHEDQTPPVQWFYVSDSEVHSVPEETVLSAEASLLFYEKIPEN